MTQLPARSFFRHVAIAAFLLALARVPVLSAAEPAVVDFRYSPPEWQTAICLPDDAHKSLVDRSGELLYHFGKGGREFGTRIGIECTTNAVWQKQELPSARIPIVRTTRSATGLEIAEEAFAITDLDQTRTSPITLQRPDGGKTSQAQPDLVRSDLILVRVTNTSAQSRTLQPRLVIDTTLPFDFQPESQHAAVNDRETVNASLKMIRIVEETKSRRVIQLDALSIPAGKSETFFVLYRSGSGAASPPTVPGALACRERAVKFWEKASLPFGRVQVPDPGIQALVDSSIRNIWQAREIKKGLPVFQVGPTCYRGLWIVDGAFLLESAAMLGAGKDCRSAVTYTLCQQKPSGAFEVLSPHYFKENGIVLWTCIRHAMLTQDKNWLESIWPQLEKAATYIKELRQRSLQDATPLDDGINPPGEIDGGLGGGGTHFIQPEFSNVHWNLAGLRAFIQAAHWLGKADCASRWQAEYNDLDATFRRAAKRDLCQDAYGNAYVPIFMANAGKELPQRAQWTFCHAVYPGQIFAQDDPLVASTLAMLQATEREDMVYGTGWDATGIWNYFASFYGHAWLWQGNGPKAARILYAFANHAAPTCVWREEQSLKGAPYNKVGDMPHNWASAEFIRLTIHLLALDRGDELHLLEGFPRAWAGPGMTTRLDGIATPFGPLYLTVKASKNGQSATANVKPLAANCRAIIVHLPDGSTRRLDPKHGGTVTFAFWRDAK